MKFDSLQHARKYLDDLADRIEGAADTVTKAGIAGPDSDTDAHTHLSNVAGYINLRRELEAEYDAIEAWLDTCDQGPEEFADEILRDNKGDLEAAAAYFDNGNFGTFDSMQEYAEQCLENYVNEDLPAVIMANIDMEGLARDLLRGEDWGIYDGVIVVRHD